MNEIKAKDPVPVPLHGDGGVLIFFHFQSTMHICMVV